MAVEMRPVDWGAKAAAELRRVARMENFMIVFGVDDNNIMALLFW